MTFQQPAVLALIPVAFLLIAATFRRKHSRSFLSVLNALLRFLCASAIVCALAGPYKSKEQAAQSVPVLVDVSSSVGVGQGDALLSRAREIASELDVPLTVIPFSKQALEPRQDSGASFSQLRRESERADTGGTDISQALSRLSVSSAPAPAALLLSDGYETAGTATAAASLLANSTRVFPLTAPGESKDPALRVSQLYVPLTVKARKATEIRATITSSAAEPIAAEVELKHGDSVVLKRKVTAAPGEDLLATALSDPAIEGLNMVSATVSWKDSEGAHSVTRIAWLSSERRSRVLLLSGTPDDERLLSQILQSHAYELESRIMSGSGPRLEEPGMYRVVLLNNVPAGAVPPGFLRALPEYVRGGGGLIMIGGNRSFGLGGYIGSPIEDTLPVELVPPKTETKRLNLAVQLVIDKSGSMAQENRIDFAKAAAREVVASLRDDDFIGVIGFEQVAFVALPLSRVGQVRYSAADRISRLYPNNSTNLYPAVEEARRGLSRVSAGRKHVIILTDGQIPDQGPIYLDLVRQLRVLGITVSTVLVGFDAPDAFLVELAQIGGGSFYHTNDPRNLPKIFLADLKVATGERTLKEDPEIPVLEGPSGIKSTTLRSFPPLRGYVETLERPGADTELVVPEEDRRFPLLASWKFGAGKAIAFTSDANGRWSAPWMRWDGVQQFWSEIVEAAQQSPLDKPSTTQFDLRAWPEGGEVVMDLSLFAEPGPVPITASVVTPQGETRSVTFSPRQKGHFRAELPGAVAGTYRTTISVGSEILPEVAWTLSGELFGEQPHRAPNLSLLEAIAERTGGRINPEADALRPFMTQVSEKRDLSLLFLAGALCLFFAELLLPILFRPFALAYRRKLR